MCQGVPITNFAKQQFSCKRYIEEGEVKSCFQVGEMRKRERYRQTTRIGDTEREQKRVKERGREGGMEG